MANTNKLFTVYRVSIGGDKLLMHDEKLVNPFNAYTQELAKLTKKRGKTLEDHKAIAEIEFHGGLYYDDKAGPYIPARCLNKCLIEGARARKLGKKFEQEVMVADEINPLHYEGPREREALWAAVNAAGEHLYADQRPVGVGDARTMRTRPCFRNWEVEFRIKVAFGAVNSDDVHLALEAAQAKGLCDGRPLYAGQFLIREFEEIE